VTWASSEVSVAMVDCGGLVTAHESGNNEHHGHRQFISWTRHGTRNPDSSLSRRFGCLGGAWEGQSRGRNLLPRLQTSTRFYPPMAC
jgi:hypothetical protein